jgi:hypothetical protein
MFAQHCTVFFDINSISGVIARWLLRRPEGKLKATVQNVDVVTHPSLSKSHAHSRMHMLVDFGNSSLHFIDGLDAITMWISQAEHLIVPQGYGCVGASYQQFYSEDLGDFVEHRRRAHSYRPVERPHALGKPDSHGHLWYFSGCDGQYERSRVRGSQLR